MKIGIPGLSKKAAAPLARMIDKTAFATGLDDATVLRVATYLWQFTAEEMAHGYTVTIPSFGAFAPWLDERLHYQGRLMMVPRFSPSAALKAQVGLTAPHSRRGKKKLRSHKRNNLFHPVTKYTHKRTTSTMEDIRRAIDAQMGET